MIPSRLRPRTIRGTIILAGSTIVAVVAVGLFGLLRLQSSMITKVEEATEAYVEEQQIANRITQSVTRQMMAASLYAAQGSEGLLDDFRAAGDEAYVQLRGYLFRSLTPEQRVQIERVKEQHQALEVATTEALAPAASSGDIGGDLVGTDLMASQTRDLQEALDAFLAMRESDLRLLRGRQESLFAYITVTAGTVGVVLILMTLLAGAFLHRRIVRPLELMSAAACRIGDGDFEGRIAAPADDELADLAESFNDMTEKLAVARRALHRRNRTLEATLSELKETQAELVQTEKLSALGEMLAGLAHELNNPLSSVLGYSELLRGELTRESPPPPEELLEECLEPLVAEARRSRDLARTLLRFSRKPDGTAETAPLRETLKIVQRLREYSFEQAGLTLHIADLPDIHVKGEPQRLQQVLLNVVNNAFDALRDGKGTALRVRHQISKSRVTLRFEDDGPGFENLERALEPFFTTKPPGSGTGLGLALVHRFMDDEFGGSVELANGSRGGATVTLAFQRVAPENRQTRRECGHSRIVDADAIAGARILVLEDEEPLRKLQARLLKRVDADVTLVASGRAALNQLASRSFDLVISDVKMPGPVSGLDVLEWVRAERPQLEESFLFVTGDVSDESVGSFAAQRPGRVISKPFEVTEYLCAVADILAAARGTGRGEGTRKAST